VPACTNRKPANGGRRKTLAAVLADAVSGTVDWAAVESLLIAADAGPVESRHSRERFEQTGDVVTFRGPHPAKEARRSQLRNARDFLERIGVTP
jgi:hypothetical protein